MDHKFFPLLHVLKDHDEPQQLIHVSIIYIYIYIYIKRKHYKYIYKRQDT